MKTYSQNYEDIILNRVFRGKEQGFYIDVGAHHPDEMSVTKLFYEKGWTGINIEPVPLSFKRFKKARTRDLNLNVAISDKSGKQEFYQVCGILDGGEDAGSLSSFDKKAVEDACAKLNLSYDAIMVKTDSLRSICDRHSVGDIDFLKVDVEGYEFLVLKSFDFKSYRPKVVLVEATLPNSYPFETMNPEDQSAWDTFEPYLIDQGYEFVYFDGLNRFYVSDECEELKPLFSVPVGIFDGVDYYSLEKKFLEREEALRVAEDRIAGVLSDLETERNALKLSEETAKNLLSDLETERNALKLSEEKVKDLVSDLETERNALKLSEENVKGLVSDLDFYRRLLDTFEEKVDGLTSELVSAKNLYRDLVICLHGWAGKSGGFRMLRKCLDLWLPSIPTNPISTERNTQPLKISVITPSFNSGAFIERAIQSVLNQEYDNWEHIIIDGGSTDGTVNLLKRYDHLEWVSETDRGQIHAMNKGFARATGDLIVYLNADDYFEEHIFGDVVEAFDPDTMMVYGNVHVYSEEKDEWWICDPKTDFCSILRHWEFNAFCVNPVGYFYRRGVQEKIPFKEENTTKMDLAFLLEAAFYFEKQTKKLDKVFGCFMHVADTQTVNEQSQPGYWVPETFSFIVPLLEKMPEDFQKSFRQDQLTGYRQRAEWSCIENPLNPKKVCIPFLPKYFINSETGLGYISIPNNACSSLKYAVLSSGTQDVSFLLNEAPRIHTHAADYFDEIIPCSWGKPVDVFTFSFVRHPVDRFLSFYRNKIYLHWDQNMDIFLRCYGFYPKMSVLECLEKIYGVERRFLNEHIAPQSDFLMVEGQLLVDFIGKIESLRDDIARLVEKVGIPLIVPRLNQTDRSDLSLYLTEDERQLLYEIYKDDFLNFSYKLDAP